MADNTIRPDRWENLADILRSIEPQIEAKIEYWRSHHPTDPNLQPATTAIIRAYVARLELQLSAIRGGPAALKDECENHPSRTEEIQELDSWITRLKPRALRRKMSEQDEDAMGNWFVSKMNYSYSQARRHIKLMREQISDKGAPSKRPETLRMLDARTANGWSYSKIAAQMCDCGAKKHTSHCSERIRKRIKELEAFRPLPSNR